MAAKSRKKRSTRQTKKKKQEQSFLRDEVTIWLTLAVSILIMLSNFGLGGSAGAKASHGLYYAFGAVAYVVPFLLFGIVAFLISNKGNVNAYLKTAAGLIFVVLTCALLELVDKIGGIIGEKITNVLAPVIGVAGTYVVVLIFMIICFVIMTGKSLLKGVKESGDRAYGKAKEDSARRRKIAKERREERSKERERLREQKAKEVLEQKKFQAEKPPKSVGKSKRSEKHVEGVSFDTTLGGGQTPAHEDMHEVSAEPQFVTAGMMRLCRLIKTRCRQWQTQMFRKRNRADAKHVKRLQNWRRRLHRLRLRLLQERENQRKHISSHQSHF